MKTSKISLPKHWGYLVYNVYSYWKSKSHVRFKNIVRAQHALNIYYNKLWEKNNNYYENI